MENNNKVEPTEEQRAFAKSLYRFAKDEYGYGYLAELIAEREARLNGEWRAAYNGPNVNSVFGPHTPEELRISIEEAEQVDREQRAHREDEIRKELLLPFEHLARIWCRETSDPCLKVAGDYVRKIVESLREP